MRVLLDENMPRGLLELFEPGIEAFTVAQRGWRGKANGELLEAAEKEFDALITTDRGIPHQQDLSAVALSVVLLVFDVARRIGHHDTLPSGARLGF